MSCPVSSHSFSALYKACGKAPSASNGPALVKERNTATGLVRRPSGAPKTRNAIVASLAKVSTLAAQCASSLRVLGALKSCELTGQDTRP